MTASHGIGLPLFQIEQGAEEVETAEEAGSREQPGEGRHEKGHEHAQRRVAMAKAAKVVDRQHSSPRRRSASTTPNAPRLVKV